MFKKRGDLLISPVVSLGFRVKRWQFGRKETRWKSGIERRVGERGGREKELWLGGRAERGREEGSPWEATLGWARKGRVWKQEEAGREGGKTSSSFRLADTKFTEEDNNNQGLDNNMAPYCWFLIVAQTNHYTSLPTSSCQVSRNPRQETGEALRPRKPVTCVTPVLLLIPDGRPTSHHERELRRECDGRQEDCEKGTWKEG